MTDEMVEGFVVYQPGKSANDGLVIEADAGNILDGCFVLFKGNKLTHAFAPGRWTRAVSVRFRRNPPATPEAST